MMNNKTIAIENGSKRAQIPMLIGILGKDIEVLFSHPNLMHFFIWNDCAKNFI